MELNHKTVRYKILIDPKTYALILAENDFTDGLVKRVVKFDELTEMTKQQFLDELARGGYRDAAECWCKNYNPYFKDGWYDPSRAPY